MKTLFKTMILIAITSLIVSCKTPQQANNSYDDAYYSKKEGAVQTNSNQPSRPRPTAQIKQPDVTNYDTTQYVTNAGENRSYDQNNNGGDNNTYQDPNNSNYFALRVNFGKNDVRNYIYFIIQQSNGKCDRDSLEEVEFESWPPTFDKKNMFKLENMNVMLS